MAKNLFSLEDGYRLHATPSRRAKVVRVSDEEGTVRVLKREGEWREICIGDVSAKCKHGEKAWVVADALKKASIKLKKKDDEATEAYNCPDGRCKKHKHHVEEDISEAADPNNPRGYSLPSNFHAACSNFIARDGLGPWGRRVVNTAGEIATDCFYPNRYIGYNLFGDICPNYKSLGPKEKNAIIALTFAAIANVESGCRTGVEVRGTNDLADGLFQLEHSAYSRQRANRDEKYCATNSDVNTFSLKFQTECAVSTVNDTICGPTHFLFDPQGYWEKLRNHREIYRNIKATARKWGICG